MSCGVGCRRGLGLGFYVAVAWCRPAATALIGASVAANCSVGHRYGVDSRLWHRPAAATLIQPRAWESPCAMGVALKRQKKKKI